MSTELAEGLSTTPRTNAAPGVPRWLLIGAIVVLVAATVFCVRLLSPAVTVRQLPAAASLPVIADVPDFTLTERDGRPISRADLLGKVWVADFIFTRCAGPCPQLSAKMRGLQHSLAEQSDLRLVSICLDPENDTPAALTHYAKRFQADARWLFLTTTDEKYVHNLAEKGFLQTVVPATGGSALVHSTYLILVDRQGRIRAAHDGLRSDVQPAVLRDLEMLLAEPALP